ncbi:MAG: alpha/beta hydrolase [Alphaproteobacteria bacterium]|nr:alpha/beta hydrolase [Alphaproteobacteria bacterium]
MKKVLALCFLLVLLGCQSIQPPKEFVYKEINTHQFKLASWQKITDVNADYRIYIEGDGYAFNAYGQPSRNPTPHGELVRELSFNDTVPNVIYLARPCQYVEDNACSVEYWTTKRFAPEVIEAEYKVIKQIAGDKEITLIGFSGGAQIAGLIAVKYPDLKIKKVITIAGNLDHKAWTDYHKLPPLDGSLNLAEYTEKFAIIEQIHYVGADDDIIPLELTQKFAPRDKIVIIKNATHNTGWQKIYSQIYE